MTKPLFYRLAGLDVPVQVWAEAGEGEVWVVPARMPAVIPTGISREGDYLRVARTALLPVNSAVTPPLF